MFLITGLGLDLEPPLDIATGYVNYSGSGMSFDRSVSFPVHAKTLHVVRFIQCLVYSTAVRKW